MTKSQNFIKINFLLTPFMKPWICINTHLKILQYELKEDKRMKIKHNPDEI